MLVQYLFHISKIFVWGKDTLQCTIPTETESFIFILITQSRSKSLRAKDAEKGNQIAQGLGGTRQEKRNCFLSSLRLSMTLKRLPNFSNNDYETGSRM